MPRSPLRPRAGGAATALFLAGLAVSGGVALLGAPMTETAQAQTVANPNDQPTAGPLPAGTSTVTGSEPAANRPTDGVAPPATIRSPTAVVGSDRDGKRATTNPLDHLPPRDRSH
ncbi:hypothetical protein [Methylobacterium nigriterrae]|uniref:hypothetical protein n=1 Tax=Methylobacterium nigriterrae TaxID=3127512 RepID=UPI00301403D6